MAKEVQQDLDGKPRPEVSEEEQEREPVKILRSGKIHISTTAKALERATRCKKKQSKKDKLVELQKWVQHKAKVSGTVEPGEWDRGTKNLYERLSERVH